MNPGASDLSSGANDADDLDVPDANDDPDVDKGCAGIILAAGGSSRFEGDKNKLLANYRGKPLVSWAVEAALEAELDDLYVVMGSVDLNPILPKEIILVHNESWETGQGCSLNVGIECAKRDGYKQVVVGLADSPLVPASAWRLVADTPGAIVTAVYGGHRSPPVKLEEQVWIMLPLTGDEGARYLMMQRPDLVVEVECEGSPQDVDTKEDLANL